MRTRRKSTTGGDAGKVSGAGRAPGRRALTDQLPVRRGGSQASSPSPATSQAEEREEVPDRVGQVEDRVSAAEDQSIATDARVSETEDRISATEDRLAKIEEALSETEKNKLIDKAGNRIDRAFTAFTAAVLKERMAIKEAAKDGLGIKIFGLLWDIGMGVLLPGLGSLISTVIAEASSAEVAHVAKRILTAGNVKTLLSQGTAHARARLLSHSPTDASEVEAFLTSLSKKNQLMMQIVSEGLYDQTDEVIVATFGAFHADIANEENYGDAVHSLTKRFQSSVQPIGGSKDGYRGSGEWRIEWTDTMTVVNVVDGDGLALVERRDRTDTGERRYRLVEYITPELQEPARMKMAARSNAIVAVRAADVKAGAW